MITRGRAESCSQRDTSVSKTNESGPEREKLKSCFLSHFCTPGLSLSDWRDCWFQKITKIVGPTLEKCGYRATKHRDSFQCYQTGLRSALIKNVIPKMWHITTVRILNFSEHHCIFWPTTKPVRLHQNQKSVREHVFDTGFNWSDWENTCTDWCYFKLKHLHSDLVFHTSYFLLTEKRSWCLSLHWDKYVNKCKALCMATYHQSMLLCSLVELNL